MKLTRNTRGSLDDLGRPAPSQEPEQRLLIVCEGELTEPSYFRKFQLLLVDVEIAGTGLNTVAVVAAAQNFVAQKPAGHYDAVWCVFDRDDFPAAHFDAAIAQATAAGFGVAYSNQSFEFWLLLHFEDHSGPLHRDDYAARLNIRLAAHNIHYPRRKEVKKPLFDLLQSTDPATGQPLWKIAGARAQALDTQWASSTLPPSQCESVTLVYRLVAVLQQQL